MKRKVESGRLNIGLTLLTFHIKHVQTVHDLETRTNGIKGALSIVPMIGLVSQQFAEDAVKRLTQEEPGAIFMIQEVGAA